MEPKSGQMKPKMDRWSLKVDRWVKSGQMEPKSGHIEPKRGQMEPKSRQIGQISLDRWTDGQMSALYHICILERTSARAIRRFAPKAHAPGARQAFFKCV
jgi:hypothetical protein